MLLTYMPRYFNHQTQLSHSSLFWHYGQINLPLNQALIESYQITFDFHAVKMTKMKVIHC